jgi:hypothetical protein
MSLPGMVAQACSPSIQEAEAGEFKAEASLGYVVEP